MPKQSSPNRMPYGSPAMSFPCPFGEGAVKDIAEHANALEEYLRDLYPSALPHFAQALALWRELILANYFPPAVTPNGWDKEQIDTQAKGSMLNHIYRGYRAPKGNADLSTLAIQAPAVQLAYLIGYSLKPYNFDKRMALHFDRTYRHTDERFNRVCNISPTADTFGQNITSRGVQHNEPKL